MKYVIYFLSLFPSFCFGQWGDMYTLRIEPWDTQSVLTMEIARPSEQSPNAVMVVSEDYGDGYVEIRFIWNHKCFLFESSGLYLENQSYVLRNSRGDIRGEGVFNGNRMCTSETSVGSTQLNLCEQKLYPNPTTGLVHMSCPNSRGWYVQNFRGKLVRKNIYPLNLSGLPDGTYLVYQNINLKHVLIKKYID